MKRAGKPQLANKFLTSHFMNDDKKCKFKYGNDRNSNKTLTGPFPPTVKFASKWCVVHLRRPLKICALEKEKHK